MGKLIIILLGIICLLLGLHHVKDPEWWYYWEETFRSTKPGEPSEVHLLWLRMIGIGYIIIGAVTLYLALYKL